MTAHKEMVDGIERPVSVYSKNRLLWHVVALGDDVGPSLMGKQALVGACSVVQRFQFDGKRLDGLNLMVPAQFVKVPASRSSVDCDWTDVELGSIPCAYGTAESMVHRAGVKEGDPRRCSRGIRWGRFGGRAAVQRRGARLPFAVHLSGPATHAERMSSPTRDVGGLR